MIDEQRALRAASFGADAAAYAEHRPDYPAAAIRWVLECSRRRSDTVVDLAAGTGKLTSGLLAAGRNAVAVEPDPAMLAQLTARHPAVPAVRGTAEAIPLRDGSVDAVFVGQAYHWFDPDRSLTEVARTLRPGGVFGVLWNHEDERVEWIAELAKLVGRGRTRNPRITRRRLEHPSFTAFERVEFNHRQRRTAASLTATIGTYSAILVLPPHERAHLLDRVHRFLLSRPETATGEFDLPVITTAVRGVYRPY